jgi:undecaprenyl-diphosphatase
MAWAGTWASIIGFVAALTAIRLAYLAFFCPYTLVEDEAHYWEWSRHLGLSYYTKGPGIAWTIFAGTQLAGATELGVRLAAPIFLGLLALGAAGLATDITRDRRAGFAAAACINCSWMFQFGGILMTIDVPYCAMWMLAAWAAWRALSRGSGPGVILCGLLLGIGFLFKYTSLLLLPGIILFALAYRRDLRLPRRAGLWLALGLAAFLVGILPVLVWNQREGWPTVRHLLGHLGVQGGDMAPSPKQRWTPLWPVEFILMNIGLHGPIIGLAVSTALWSRKIARESSPQAAAVRATLPGRMFLVWCALPLLVFYFGVTFFTDGEGNWTAAAYTSLCALAGIGAVDGVDQTRARLRAWLALPAPRPKWGYLRREPENPRQMFWHLAVVAGIIAGIAMLRLDLLGRVPGLDRVIPVGRLTSARAQAADADARLATLAPDAMVIAQHYGRASQLAFYMKDRPVVRCSSSFMGGRPTQYDYWAGTSLTDPALIGRDALLIGASNPEWATAFQRVDDAGVLAGDHKRNRPVFYGRAFRGFPAPARGTPR